MFFELHVLLCRRIYARVRSIRTRMNFEIARSEIGSYAKMIQHTFVASTIST